MTPYPGITLGLLLALTLLLGGCSLPFMGSKGDVPQTHTYLLEWTPRAPAPRPAAGAPTLLVAPVRAAAGYTSSDLVYTKTDHELARFAYHRWADAPARMLEPLLQAVAENTGQFSAVIPAGSQARADLRLDSQLLRLRQEFQDGTCNVVLAIRADLIEITSGRLKAGRQFSYREPCDAPTPQAGIAAANRLAARFAEDLALFLEQAVVKTGP